MEQSGEDAFIIYTDGASRGNPGMSASGFLIIGPGSKKIAKKAFYNGIKTNNYAEYTAIIKALEWCEANLARPERSAIKVISDSELAVKQLNGAYKIRSEEMLRLNLTVKDLAKWFKGVSFFNRRRSDSGISEVDAMLNAFLDKASAK